MAREELLTRTLVELADNLVDDFDVIDFLTFLSGRCVELVPTTSAGILLVDPSGSLQFAAASSEDAELLELFSLQHDEGPCLDCFSSGEPVSHPDLSAGEVPWPSFGPVAVEAGFRSVHALPMRLRQDVIGSLNLFKREPGPLAEEDLLVGQALADIATISIVQQQAMRDAKLLSEQLGFALTSRVLIEQAKGVLAERCQIDMDEAFTRMRRFSRADNRRLRGVAAAIIDGSLSAEELTRLTEDA